MRTIKILVDLGHAGHVHYYKNLILDERYSDLDFLVVARNKQPIPKLLQSYKIVHILRKDGGLSKLGKLLYLVYGNLLILKKTMQYKPDILLSHGGVYTGLASFLLRIKSITTEDTEGATLSHKISKMFSTFIITPKVFSTDLGKKQVKFDSYMEYAYLHNMYFKKNKDVLKKYNVDLEKKYVLVRLVDWTAHHDFNVPKLSYHDKLEIVEKLAKDYKIILSYETSIPESLKKYTLNIAPEDLHHLLAYASLYIGEGATTASEASILGTPAIYINSMQVCYCKDQEENYNLSFNLLNKDEILSKAKELLVIKKEEFVKRAQFMAKNRIDTTKFLYDFIKKVNV